jgi:hypothetical protein
MDYADSAQGREGKDGKQDQRIESGRLDDGSSNDGGGPQNRGNDGEPIHWCHVALRFEVGLVGEQMVARREVNVGAPIFKVKL